MLASEEEIQAELDKWITKLNIAKNKKLDIAERYNAIAQVGQRINPLLNRML